MHGGLTDPKAIGRKGGSRSPLTRLRREADDELRERARAVLPEQLEGDDERRRLEAAKSFSAIELQRRRLKAKAAGPRAASRSRAAAKSWGLSDLLELCLEEVTGIFESARKQDVMLRTAERVREVQAPTECQALDLCVRTETISQALDPGGSR